MKIVHVLSGIDPALGGPQGGVVRLAAAQAALGHEVRILGHGDDATFAKAARAAEAVPGFGRIAWTLIAEPRGLQGMLGWSLATDMHHTLAGCDFVHLHGVWDTLLRIAAANAARLALPYCVTPHGMLDRWSMAQKPWKKGLAMRLGYRRMLDSAVFLQALNADEVELMAPLGLTAPSVIIPNGIFPEEVSRLPEPGTFRRTVPGLGGRPYVLFLSRLHSKKGLDILAHAFRAVASAFEDVDLVVVGPDGGAKAEFQALVRSLDLASRVHIVGPRFGTDKLAALVDAACFCLPSRQEGFSIAITEALACAVPVAISEACHFPEVAVAGAGLVLPLDPAAFSEGLLSILRDGRMATEMGRRGRELVLKRYTWPAIAQASIDAYRTFQPRESAAASRRRTGLAGLPT